MQNRSITLLRHVATLVFAEKLFINGEEELINSKPCPENHKLRIRKPIEDKIIYLRQTYHFGPDMIVRHLQRYREIKVSRNGCYNVLVRNKLIVYLITYQCVLGLNLIDMKK